MHLQRLRRTGELGGAESKVGQAYQREYKNKKLLEALRGLRAAAGLSWRIVSNGRASCNVVGVTRRQKPEESTPLTLRAFERRGWLRIGPWQANGERAAEVTKAGERALDS